MTQIKQEVKSKEKKSKKEQEGKIVTQRKQEVKSKEKKTK